MNRLEAAAERTFDTIGPATVAVMNFVGGVSRTSANLWNSVRTDGPTAFLVTSVNGGADFGVVVAQRALEFTKNIPSNMQKNPNFAFGFIAGVNVVFFTIMDRFLNAFYQKLEMNQSTAKRARFQNNLQKTLLDYALLGSAFSACNLALRKATGFNALSNTQIIAISVVAIAVRSFTNPDAMKKYQAEIQTLVSDKLKLAKDQLRQQQQQQQQQQLQEANKAKAEAETQVTQLTQELEKANTNAQAQVAKLTQELNVAKQQVEADTQELERAKQELDAVRNELQEANTAAEAQVTKITQELEQAKHELEATRKQLQEANIAAEAQVANLTQELEASHKKLDGFQEKFERFKKELAELKQHHNELEQQVVAANHARNALEQNITNISDSSANKKAKANQLATLVENLKRKS